MSFSPASLTLKCSLFLAASLSTAVVLPCAKGLSSGGDVRLITPRIPRIHNRRIAISVPPQWRIRAATTKSPLDVDLPVRLSSAGAVLDHLPSGWDVKSGIDVRIGHSESSHPSSLTVNVGIELTSRADRHGVFDGKPFRTKTGWRGTWSTRDLAYYNIGKPGEYEAILALRVPETDYTAEIRVNYTARQRRTVLPTIRAVFASAKLLPPAKAGNPHAARDSSSG